MDQGARSGVFWKSRRFVPDGVLDRHILDAELGSPGLVPSAVDASRDVSESFVPVWLLCDKNEQQRISALTQKRKDPAKKTAENS